jgi:hypothetical protein
MVALRHASYQYADPTWVNWVDPIRVEIKYNKYKARCFKLPQLDPQALGNLDPTGVWFIDIELSRIAKGYLTGFAL